MHASSGWNGLVWGDQNDFTRVIWQAEDQDFGHEFANLAGRKIDNGKDLFADQGFWRVMSGDLGRAFADADVAAEIEKAIVFLVLLTIFLSIWLPIRNLGQAVGRKMRPKEKP